MCIDAHCFTPLGAGMDFEAAKKADKTNDWCGKSVITWLC